VIESESIEGGIMAAYRIFTETILYTDSEDEAWDAFAWITMDQLQWDIEKIVIND
jgi:hypothetical protein